MIIKINIERLKVILKKIRTLRPPFTRRNKILTHSFPFKYITPSITSKCCIAKTKYYTHAKSYHVTFDKEFFALERKGQAEVTPV